MEGEEGLSLSFFPYVTVFWREAFIFIYLINSLGRTNYYLPTKYKMVGASNNARTLIKYLVGGVHVYIFFYMKSSFVIYLKRNVQLCYFARASFFVQFIKWSVVFFLKAVQGAVLTLH